MMRGGSMRGKGKKLIDVCLGDVAAISERLASNSMASSSGSGSGVVLQINSSAGLRGLRTIAREILTQHKGRNLHPNALQLLREADNKTVVVLKRSFCSKPPFKGFENFYPKGRKGRTKEAGEIPKKKGERIEKESEGAEGFAKTKEQKEQQTQQQLTFILLSLATVAVLSWGWGRSDTQEVSFQWFKTNLLAPGMVDKLEVLNKTNVRVYVKPSSARSRQDHQGIESGTGLENEMTGQKSQVKFHFNVGSVDSFERKLDEAQEDLGWRPDMYVPVTYVTEMSVLNEVFKLAPTILLIGAYIWFTRRSMGGISGTGGLGGGGKGIFSVGKAQVQTIDKNAKDKIVFKDVAGCDEAKQEVMEFVKFLKSPGKYKEIGAKIPKGALLTGPPGTGKTLLAKATAGEAGVPFLSISGSDFMEMFVGVGPARVRDLFAQARTQAPSIIFIDEIDAIGRARGRGGFAGGNDERENTLNQLLVEMDGFATSTGVVVLAGTNRPDILDPALLRPGRFDRQISLDRPDIKGREHIFRLHLAKLKLSNTMEYFSERMAALTPGFAGADIANVCNEAALIAARSTKSAIELVDFEAAVDRVIGGLEKKNKVITVEERRTVAFHEAGHAVAAWFLKWAEPLLKVSIVPRGSATLGFAQYLPNESVLMTTEQMDDMICMALGGRAAEQIMLGRITTGAQNDLERITKMAYNQVAVYGMNKKIGLLSYPPQERKQYGSQTAQIIDREVRKIVDSAYERTINLLTEKKALVEKLALALLDKEVVNIDALEEILGPRPFKNAQLRNIDKYREGFKEGDSEKEASPEGSHLEDSESPPGSHPEGTNLENPISPPTPTPEGKIPGTLDGPGTPHSM